MGKESIIGDDLLKDITAFCKLNELDNTTFINKLLKDAYMEFKWLDKEPTPLKEEKPQEKPEEVEIKKEQEPVTERNFFGPKNNKDLYNE